MIQCRPLRYLKISPEVTRLAMMLDGRSPLSLRNLKDLLHERGIAVSHETVRFWYRETRVRSWRNWWAATAVAVMVAIGSALSAQPLGGTHEPRTYDEGLIPRFSLELIELDARGTLGVAALDTESGERSTWRASDRFPLNSTKKFLLCAAVLMRVDAGQEDLTRTIPVGAEDVVPHSPVLESRVSGSRATKELCHAAMTRSDKLFWITHPASTLPAKHIGARRADAILASRPPDFKLRQHLNF